jgi:hypothetical protein
MRFRAAKGTTVVGLSMAGLVFLSACGGNSVVLSQPSTPSTPPSRGTTTLPSTTAVPATTPASSVPGAPIALLGDGIATVQFGQGETAAVTELDAVLGSPVSDTDEVEEGNCGIDAVVQWSTITTFFEKGVFVGYSTETAHGAQLAPGSLITTTGLSVGDSLAEAQHLYGSAMTTSFAQGGSWFATTSDGTLDGYLSAEPNQPEMSPHIESIEAGSVGCPAVSP